MGRSTRLRSDIETKVEHKTPALLGCRPRSGCVQAAFRLRSGCVQAGSHGLQRPHSMVFAQQGRCCSAKARHGSTFRVLPAARCVSRSKCEHASTPGRSRSGLEFVASVHFPEAEASDCREHRHGRLRPAVTSKQQLKTCNVASRVKAVKNHGHNELKAVS